MKFAARVAVNLDRKYRERQIPRDQKGGSKEGEMDMSCPKAKYTHGLQRLHVPGTTFVVRHGRELVDFIDHEGKKSTMADLHHLSTILLVPRK